MLRHTTVAEIASPAERSIAIGPFGSSLRADMYTPIGVPVVRGQNITDAREIDLSDVVFVSPDTAEKFPACMLEEGDLVFPHRGAIGRVGLVGKRPALLSSSMMKLRCDPSKADSRFILYYFRGPGHRELMMRASTVGTPGIGQPLTSLRGIPIQIPPIVEQRAIAEVLGALDDKIAANTKLASVIDELAEAFTRTSIDRDLAEPLSRVAEVIMGSSPTGVNLNEDGRGTVFFQGVRDFGFRFPKRRIWTEQVTRLAEVGDTLVSVRAPVGRVNIASEPICIGRGLASVRTKIGKPSTLFNLLKAFPGIWEPFEAEGTIFGSINRAQLEGIQVPRVKPELASELEARLVGLESSIKSALAENDSLVAMRDTLLPELMSGRLRVKDAEKKVGEVV